MDQKLSELIVFKNRKYVIAQKPPGISSQVNLSEEKSLQNYLEIYLKHKIHVINRIDRPVHGLVLYASSKEAAATLTNMVRERKINKYYLALVESKPPEETGILKHFLSRNAKNRKAIINDVASPRFKESILNYELLHSFENYHLLKIQTVTGRFHQIRAQLGKIGCPIKGDVKYGARRSNKDRSIHLLAYHLAFKDPFTGEQVSLNAEIPTSDGLWKDVAEVIKKG